MGIFENKVADLLAGLASSFQLLLPATFLVVGLALLLIPSAMTDNTFVFVAMGIAVLTVYYMLYAFNAAIMNFFKGDLMPNWAPIRALRDYQIAKFHSHHRRVYECQQKITDIKILENEWQFRQELSQERERQLEKWRMRWLDRIVDEKKQLEQYPPIPDMIVALRLGNVITAAEVYSKHRYGIEMGQLWPRFTPTLLENKYTAFIESEKAILDFLISMVLVSGGIWVVAVCVFALTGRPEASLLSTILPLPTYLLYKGACIAAVNWGTTVKSAFDLYRFELKKALNLQLPDGAEFPEERKMWRGISEFLAYGRRENFGGFDYTSMYAKTKGPAQQEDEK